jgi:Protein of unknown function (DUF3892)
MVEITAVHMIGGERHEHIAEVRWRDPGDGQTGASSRAQMVSYLRDDNGRAYVGSGSNQVWVGDVDGTPPYIRTYADGVWTNNLLALPRY